jgi:hypothetical protein
LDCRNDERAADCRGALGCDRARLAVLTVNR